MFFLKKKRENENIETILNEYLSQTSDMYRQENSATGEILGRIQNEQAEMQNFLRKKMETLDDFLDQLESIFTGLNNLKVLTITDVRFDEYFGFTDTEVREMLEYYGLQRHYERIKEWYDGYLFGNTAVYCPWDVINYCDLLNADPVALPENYWANTSGNAIVRRFIDKANNQTKNEIERLIAGESIVKEIQQELTYNELDKTINNLWCVLFTTGYLTQKERVDSRKYRLAIPNREIHELFVLQIREWFQEETLSDVSKLNSFCEAFAEEKPQKAE